MISAKLASAAGEAQPSPIAAIDRAKVYGACRHVRLLVLKLEPLWPQGLRPQVPTLELAASRLSWPRNLSPRRRYRPARRRPRPADLDRRVRTRNNPSPWLHPTPRAPRRTGFARHVPPSNIRQRELR